MYLNIKYKKMDHAAG